MGVEGGAERRRAPRIPQTFVVKYHWEEDGQSKWGLSQTKDLSAVGLRFVAERQFPVGTRLEFEVRLSTTTQPVKVKGKIAWLKERPLFSITEYGVEFVELDEAAQQAIQVAVKFFRRRS